MTKQFQWLEMTPVYRELRKSNHGDELRWLVNRETIVNRRTGDEVTRSTLRHPGIAVIVPFVENDRILLMHQYRYALDGLLWELPAGTLEGKEEDARMIALETPDACAKRELLEETGYEAGRLEKIGECYAMPGMSDELIHLFFAFDLVRREQSLDIGEVIEEIRPYHLTEVEGMIERGEIRDAKSLLGLFYALR
jgi:ADP-ribose pyrophosphatase